MALHRVEVHLRAPHEIDEDVLERALRRVEVGEADAGGAHVVEQRGDAGAPGLRVVGEGQLRGRPATARAGARRAPAGSRRAARCSSQHELLLAELAHQLGLLLDEDQLALGDDADAVGHLLGFLDVVRGQDDGDAGGAQLAHHLPHVLAQFDVDAGGRLVEEQDASARAPAPWRSARGASCRPTAS